MSTLARFEQLLVLVPMLVLRPCRNAIRCSPAQRSEQLREGMDLPFLDLLRRGLFANVPAAVVGQAAEVCGTRRCVLPVLDPLLGRHGRPLGDRIQRLALRLSHTLLAHGRLAEDVAGGVRMHVARELAQLPRYTSHDCERYEDVEHGQRTTKTTLTLDVGGRVLGRVEWRLPPPGLLTLPVTPVA